MAGHFTKSDFVPLNLAILTVSDSRTEENDKSGDTLKERATKAGHKVVEKCIVPDDVYQMRATVSRWIADAWPLTAAAGPRAERPGTRCR